MLRYHGLNVTQKPDKDTDPNNQQHGLPTPLSIETLKNEQYLCVVFPLIHRLSLIDLRLACYLGCSALVSLLRSGS